MKAYLKYRFFDNITGFALAIMPFMLFCLALAVSASFVTGLKVSMWTIIKVIVCSYFLIIGSIALLALAGAAVASMVDSKRIKKHKN